MNAPDGEELTGLLRTAGFARVQDGHHHRRGRLRVLAVRA